MNAKFMKVFPLCAILSDIKYRAGYMVADLDKLELLSDVIVHIDDTV